MSSTALGAEKAIIFISDGTRRNINNFNDLRQAVQIRYSEYVT